MLLDLKKMVNTHSMYIMGVLHIGAHFGQEAEVYNDLGIKKRIFFEPVPETFRQLKENLGEEEGTLINSALGNKNGKVEMNIETANSGQSSSILEPSLHLQQYPHIQFNKKIEVDMVRLDDFMMSVVNPNLFNFINIDVQGYELEVFKGAEETLKHIDYIMTEVNRAEVYKDCCMVGDLDDFLSAWGFRRVETTWAGQTWGDALYIK